MSPKGDNVHAHFYYRHEEGETQVCHPEFSFFQPPESSALYKEPVSPSASSSLVPWHEEIRQSECRLCALYRHLLCISRARPVRVAFACSQ